jgi:hypothetical protein
VHGDVDLNLEWHTTTAAEEAAAAALCRVALDKPLATVAAALSGVFITDDGKEAKDDKSEKSEKVSATEALQRALFTVWTVVRGAGDTMGGIEGAAVAAVDDVAGDGGDDDCGYDSRAPDNNDGNNVCVDVDGGSVAAALASYPHGSRAAVLRVNLAHCVDVDFAATANLRTYLLRVTTKVLTHLNKDADAVTAPKVWKHAIRTAKVLADAGGSGCGNTRVANSRGTRFFLAEPYSAAKCTLRPAMVERAAMLVLRRLERTHADMAMKAHTADVRACSQQLAAMMSSDYKNIRARATTTAVEVAKRHYKARGAIGQSFALSLQSLLLSPILFFFSSCSNTHTHTPILTRTQTHTHACCKVAAACNTLRKGFRRSRHHAGADTGNGDGDGDGDGDSDGGDDDEDCVLVGGGAGAGVIMRDSSTGDFVAVDTDTKMNVSQDSDTVIVNVGVDEDDATASEEAVIGALDALASPYVAAWVAGRHTRLTTVFTTLVTHGQKHSHDRAQVKL